MKHICTYKDCLLIGFYVPDIVFPLGGRLSLDTIVLCEKHMGSFPPDQILRDLFKRDEIRKVIEDCLGPYGIDIPHPDDCSLEWKVYPETVVSPGGIMQELKQ